MAILPNATRRRRPVANCSLRTPTVSSEPGRLLVIIFRGSKICRVPPTTSNGNKAPVKKVDSYRCHLFSNRSTLLIQQKEWPTPSFTYLVPEGCFPHGRRSCRRSLLNSHRERQSFAFHASEKTPTPLFTCIVIELSFFPV